MVPHYYLAAISLSLFHSLCFSDLICTFSFMRIRYTGYLRECDSGFTYTDDGHVPYTLARRRIRAVAMVRKRGGERARVASKGVRLCNAPTAIRMSVRADRSSPHACALHGRDFVVRSLSRARVNVLTRPATPLTLLTTS